MSERPPGPDDVPSRGDHRPMLVRWGSRHTLPAEVCDTCSSPTAGKWQPVSFCAQARAKIVADPDCAYTYGVIGRWEDVDAG